MQKYPEYELKNADLPHLSVKEFEKMLQIYGMTKTEYCAERGKCRSWFNTVLCKKETMPFREIEKLSNMLGNKMFMQLVKEVKEKE
jgi:hypothetical protein